MLIKNAKLCNEEIIDIYIKKDKIVANTQVKNDIELDLKGKYYVSAGWIDGHAHAFNDYEFIGDDIDTIGVKSGVTTLIDAGTVGSDDIDKLKEANQKSLTDVYTLMNISKIGIIRQNELANLNDIDKQLFVKTYNENKEIVKGIKARMSGSVVGDNGIKPLMMAKEIQSIVNLPLMVHIGNPDPDLDEILNILGNNDILTHCFHGKKTNILDNTKATKQLLTEALGRGLTLDIGHGTSSFSYEVYKRAKRENIIPDVISTDIYRYNRINGPVYDFSTTISKFLNLGMRHEDIIEKITEIPARKFNLSDRGKIKEGLKADLTIYEIIDENKKLIDSEGVSLDSKQLFKVKYVVKNGMLLEIGE